MDLHLLIKRYKNIKKSDKILISQFIIKIKPKDENFDFISYGYTGKVIKHIQPKKCIYLARTRETLILKEVYDVPRLSGRDLRSLVERVRSRN